MATINEISKHTGIEGGHAKNVANLGVMLSRLQGFGTRYNPTQLYCERDKIVQYE